MIPQDDERTQIEHLHVNPEMVILARESRGFSQEALAAALEVSQGRISKIETGMLDVPDDLLEQLADVLGYPVHFFTQEGRMMPVEIAEIFHRKRQDVPVKLLNQIYARMDIYRRHVAALLRATDIECRLRRLDIDEYNGQASLIAKLVRAGLRLPRGPVHDLTRSLEDAGIIVITMDFETDKVDAISRWVPGLPPMMFVNERIPKDRCRFSLAHELGHLVMHEQPNQEIERQANEFAAEFLMPELDIRHDLYDLTLTKLAQLKRHWRVAMAALLYRAQDLGTITATKARTLWADMARRGYKTHEPVELDPNSEQPSLIRELIAIHQKTLRYRDSELAYLLRLKEDEFWSLYLQGWTRPTLRAV